MLVLLQEFSSGVIPLLGLGRALGGTLHRSTMSVFAAPTEAGSLDAHGILLVDRHCPGAAVFMGFSQLSAREGKEQQQFLMPWTVKAQLWCRWDALTPAEATAATNLIERAAAACKAASQTR
jgi:hypothetical protein